MLKVFKFFISFVFFGISIGLPIKDQEIDELIYRLQELKHQSRYNGAGTEINQNSHSKSNQHRIVDLERKPLLYDYYANTLNPVNAKRFDEIDRVGMFGLQGKRNFDEIDRSGLSGFHGKRNFDEIDRSGFSGFHGKRNFDEIDRSGISGFHGKRNFDEIDRSGISGFHGKRNFDEIDRSGISGLHKRSIDNSERYYMTTGPDEMNSGFGEFLNQYYNVDRDVVKRNFDEIDRFGPGGFLKRNFQRQLDEISRLGARGSQFTKKNFDEIDRFGFTGLKRSEKFTVPKINN